MTGSRFLPLIAVAVLLMPLWLQPAPANASPITRTFDISASGFGVGAPIDPFTATVTVTFEFTATDDPVDSAVTNHPGNGGLLFAPILFNYNLTSDILTFGADGAAGFPFPQSDDFLIEILGASSPNPGSNFVFYTVGTSQSIFQATTVIVTFSDQILPEPATGAFLAAALAGLGFARSRRWSKRVAAQDPSVFR